MFKPYEPVKFWCFKVLPLVYDDSLSYYEVLCKLRDKINDMIVSMSELDATITGMQQAIAKIEEWIRDFDTNIITEWLNEHLMSMFFVEIDDSGYFKIYIPEGWEDVTFKTSGWDEVLDPPLDYGHLILHY